MDTNNGGKRKVTIETVQQAIMGAQIGNSGQLLASYGGVPKHCSEAIETVERNPNEFEVLLEERLGNLPQIQYHFGSLIRARLRQKGALTSPIISLVFDDYQRLESRLARVQSIQGVSELRREYRPCRDPERGDITDQVAIDFLAEVLVLDFLLALRFTRICKVVEEDNKARVDILARKEGRGFAIEVTRKKEIEGWTTMPFGSLENCEASTNREKIRSLLLKALVVKSTQFSRAQAAGTITDGAVRVVAIKTSDFGFAECMDQAEQLAKTLITEPSNWQHIDCIWLLPNVDVGQSRWICR